MITVEAIREWIVMELLNKPVLGQNYVDWHTEDGECGVTLMYGKEHFDITIRKHTKE